MGMSLKAVIVASLALILLNMARAAVDGYLPAILKRDNAQGIAIMGANIGLDDVVDGAILVAVLYGIHKVI